MYSERATGQQDHRLATYVGQSSRQTLSKLDGIMANVYAGSAPWAHMVELLRTQAGMVDKAVFPDRSRKLALQAIGSAAETKVTVTGRSSDRSITVMWCNPTIGYYGAQTWCSTFAQEDGVCQMSGEEIHRGDPVYRPRSGSSPPINGRAMILACHVDVPAIDDAPPVRVSPVGRTRAKSRRRQAKTSRDARK